MTFMPCPECGVPFSNDADGLDCDLIDLATRCPYIQAKGEHERLSAEDCPVLVAAAATGKARRGQRRLAS